MTAPAPSDRNKSGRLTISGLPTRSNRTFSPGEMTARTFIQHVLTDNVYLHCMGVNAADATFPCPLSSLPIGHTAKNGRIMTTCGDQYKAMPDRILKPQALPSMEYDAR